MEIKVGIFRKLKTHILKEKGIVYEIKIATITGHYY